MSLKLVVEKMAKLWTARSALQCQPVSLEMGTRREFLTCEDGVWAVYCMQQQSVMCKTLVKAKQVQQFQQKTGGQHTSAVIFLLPLTYFWWFRGRIPSPPATERQGFPNSQWSLRQVQDFGEPACNCGSSIPFSNSDEQSCMRSLINLDS